MGKNAVLIRIRSDKSGVIENGDGVLSCLGISIPADRDGFIVLSWAPEGCRPLTEEELGDIPEGAMCRASGLVGDWVAATPRCRDRADYLYVVPAQTDLDRMLDKPGWVLGSYPAVNEWQYYVPYSVRKEWADLSHTARKCIYTVAKNRADSEKAKEKQDAEVQKESRNS